MRGAVGAAGDLAPETAAKQVVLAQPPRDGENEPSVRHRREQRGVQACVRIANCLAWQLGQT